MCTSPTSSFTASGAAAASSEAEPASGAEVAGADAPPSLQAVAAQTIAATRGQESLMRR
jgi:hypothetical protein